MSRDKLIASILGASSPKPVKVKVDGAGEVFVRVMTAFDADSTRKKLDAHKKEDGCETGRLLAMLLCDAEGNLLFDIADAETVLKLAKLPPSVSTAVMGAANEANGAGKS